ncbi:SRPBCC family protein [Rhabdothermincola salaria]|uniref:SRPBCC family protein n=1 Tax=Rhabdothermincola salaria TaxID=2903142 RepID=UPI001E319B08|nr:SRPBCC family protein [Rhabdothermincola salaria]MCD9623905.1 SRPBCC family protein [Rhabdothermincola salaria]
MRQADEPEISVDVTVLTEPAPLWALVTDIELPARFSGELQGAHWLDDVDGPALGARFVGRNRRLFGTEPVEWETTSTVTALEPQRRFEWSVGDVDQPIARWRFDLEPRGAGATQLTMWAKVGTATSGLTMAVEARPDREEGIVAARLEEWRANMAATLDGIKALAEQPRR